MDENIRFPILHIFLSPHIREVFMKRLHNKSVYAFQFDNLLVITLNTSLIIIRTIATIVRIATNIRIVRIATKLFILQGN